MNVSGHCLDHQTPRGLRFMISKKVATRRRLGSQGHSNLPGWDRWREQWGAPLSRWEPTSWSTGWETFMSPHGANEYSFIKFFAQYISTLIKRFTRLALTRVSWHPKSWIFLFLGVGLRWPLRLFSFVAGEGFQLLGTVLLGGAFCGAHPGRWVAWRGQLGALGALGMGWMDDGWLDFEGWKVELCGREDKRGQGIAFDQGSIHHQLLRRRKVGCVIVGQQHGKFL